MRWLVGATVVIACKGEDPREARPTTTLARGAQAPEAPSAGSSSDAPSAENPIDATARDAVVTPPSVALEGRTRPAPLPGPEITLEHGETKTLAGIAITYRWGGGGAREGGSGALAHFELRRAGRTVERGFVHRSDSPGDLAEIAAFGHAFEVSWKRMITVKHLGKERSPDAPGCAEAIEREAAAMGLIADPDDHAYGRVGAGGLGVLSTSNYKDWRVYCADQSLRVWVARKRP